MPRQPNLVTSGLELRLCLSIAYVVMARARDGHATVNEIAQALDCLRYVAWCLSEPEP